MDQHLDDNDENEIIDEPKAGLIAFTISIDSQLDMIAYGSTSEISFKPLDITGHDTQT